MRQKVLLVVGCLLLCSQSLFAQTVSTTANRIRTTGATPSGACGPNGSALMGTAGLYLCPNGTWSSPISGPGALPAGSGSELQFRSSGSAFGAITGSSVSGGNVNLAGTLTLTGSSAALLAMGQTGATNPAFSVSGAAVGTGISVTPQASGYVTLGTLGTNAHLVLSPNGSGNVGIGTTTPARQLELSQANAAIDVYPLRLTNSDNTGWGSGLEFYASYGTSANIRGSITSQPVGAANSASGNLLFATSNSSGTLGTRLSLAATAYISTFLSVGTTAIPGVALDVNGEIRNNDTYTMTGGGLLSFGSGPGAGNTSFVIKAAANNSLYLGANNSNTAGILVQTTGTVGIGTTTPTAAQLQILSSSTTLPGLRVQAAAGTAGTQEVLGVYDGAGAIAARFTASGRLALPDGTETAPSLTFVSSSSRGFYTDGTSVILADLGGKRIGLSPFVLQTTAPIQIDGGSALRWASGDAFTTSADLFLNRAAAANLRLGAVAVDTNAALVGQTLSVQNLLAGGTADQAGKDFTLDMSQGKGTGAGGSLVVRVAPAGTSGTAVNALSEAMRVTSAGNVGIGTNAPTHTLTLNSTATGVALYNTADQTTNYERLVQAWSGNAFSISVGKAGTGTQRNLFVNSIGGGEVGLMADGTIKLTRHGVNDRWQVDPNGHFFASTDNTYDIGASGANRPRHYFGSGDVTLGGKLTIGAGTTISKHLSATATLDFANQAAIGCEVLTITVTGAAVGDTVAIGVPNGSDTTNSIFYGWVSATNTVSIKHCALVSGDPASGSFRVDVWAH